MEALINGVRKANLLIAITATLVAGAAPSYANHSSKHNLHSDLYEQVATPHFVVHFTSNSASENQISAGAAATLAGNAEQAYSVLVDGGISFATPIPDLDGKTDIYVIRKISSKDEISGIARRNSSSSETSSGYITIRSQSATTARTIAHELFHILQYAWTTGTPKFISESTANWGAAQVTGKPPATPLFGSLSLDCLDDQPCAGSNKQLPYKQWAFFQYLSERFGPAIMRSIFADIRQRKNELRQKFGSKAKLDNKAGLAAIDTALRNNGSSLAAAFSGYIRTAALGTFSIDGLKKLKLPTTSYMSVNRRLTKNRFSLTDSRLSLDHLTAKVVKIEPGSGEDSERFETTCAYRTRSKEPLLKVTVRYPQSIQTPPLLFSSQSRKPYVVKRNGSSSDGQRKTRIEAHIKCDPDSPNSDLPALVLFNDEPSADAQIFHVYAQVVYSR